MTLKFGDPASIAAAAAAAAKPIEQMWLSFGKRSSQRCYSCAHWLSYGITCGLYERTNDGPRNGWDGNNAACGKWEREK